MRSSTPRSQLMVAALMLIAVAGVQRLALRRPLASLLTGQHGGQAANSSPTKARQGAAIWGRVVDERGPVAGAQVRVQGALAAVVTDREGQFQLAVADRPATIAAAKAGYRIGTVPLESGPLGAEPLSAAPLEIKLSRLPTNDCATYAWVDPTPDKRDANRCGNCHPTIYNEWQTSAHGRGTANREFMAFYAGSAIAAEPTTAAAGGTGPTKAGHDWNLLAEHPQGIGVCGSCHAPAADLDNPASDDLRRLDGIAAGGVQCDFCHKVQDVNVEHVGYTHGRFAMQLLRPEKAAEQVFFGPLDDANRGTDAWSPLQSDSRYCSSCHEGTLFGVPVYTTYSEWLASPAPAQGKQCQTCHMAPSGEMHNVAPGAGGLERNPQSLASHNLLPGGRLAMLQRCLQLSAALTGTAGAPQLEVELRASDVGHRVPTGFIDRHLILVVEVHDAAGLPVEISDGPRLPPAAGDELAGQGGLLLAKLLQSTDGDSPVPFWRAGATATDTRLTPDEPVHSRYTLPPIAATVTVRLVYRRFWQAAAREHGWPDDDLLVSELCYRLDAGALAAGRD